MFAVTMFGAVTASAAFSQSSQTINVKVPFAFTVNKRIHPAGNYRIESLGGNRVVWKIRGMRDKPAEFLLATSLAGETIGNPHVTFRRYGNMQFLAGFKTQSFDVSLSTSRREKMLQMARKQVVPEEVIDLEPVTGGSR